ncbi:MAG: carbohydrate ABC transporter permease, partial [Terrimicrobiaceae bacterium]
MRSNPFTFLRFVCTALTVIMALAWLSPLYWILSTSLTAETATIALPPTFIPVPPDLEAFTYVIQNSPIFRWYFNTVLVSLVITLVSILVSLMCAYALSILEFKGKGLINVWLLLGFMIPFGAMVIPLFMLMNQLHLVNSYAGVILPQIATPLSVIVFKRFFDQVPRDFRDAAVIDGANEFRVLFNIYIPLNWSIIWAMAIITFIGAWNNFLWPFIITNSTPMLTVPVGMTQVQSAYG